eukprot:3459139-Prorocentrum_lima.AAC.1
MAPLLLSLIPVQPSGAQPQVQLGRRASRTTSYPAVHWMSRRIHMALNINVPHIKKAESDDAFVVMTLFS